MITRRGLLLQAGLGVDSPGLETFVRLLRPNAQEAREAVKDLAAGWRDSHAIMLIEMLRVLAPPDPAMDPSSHLGRIHRRVQDLLTDRTGKGFGLDLKAWERWAWSLPYTPHPRYSEFKGMLYSNIDPRMRAFFPPGVKSTIRLDEVEWGGVRVNGIPPLVDPAMIPASGASYLKDSNVVFGIEWRGQAKAYPKRILAWHEMARDSVGGESLAIVYCTLCGTVIPYRAEAGGRKFTFGTSGLLYRSSKLMFDEETLSLWPTLQGSPAIGDLAGTDLQLEFAPVVTTTWGDWRREHPATQVLSPDTGHTRDYAEGAAYRDYFADDKLMFEVSQRDGRLKNKEEVLAIRLPGKRPLAISARFLEKRPRYELEHEGVHIEVRTAAGANRVYLEGKQIPAHRAYWFGWYAQFPQTVLVK